MKVDYMIGGTENMINDLNLETVKEITKEDLKGLLEFEIIPSDEYKTGKARRLYPKDCYRKAFQYVSSKQNLDGVKLVHGLYKPFSIDFYSGHAWVELPNEVIFDGVLQRFYQKEGYYNYYQIIKEAEYDHTEMYKCGFENGGTYGPWLTLNV